MQPYRLVANHAMACYTVIGTSWHQQTAVGQTGSSSSSGSQSTCCWSKSAVKTMHSFTLVGTWLCFLQVQKLIEKIFAIPDGIGGNRRPMRVRQKLAAQHSTTMQQTAAQHSARRTISTSSSNETAALRKLQHFGPAANCVHASSACPAHTHSLPALFACASSTCIMCFPAAGRFPIASPT